MVVVQVAEKGQVLFLASPFKFCFHALLECVHAWCDMCRSTGVLLRSDVHDDVMYDDVVCDDDVMCDHVVCDDVIRDHAVYDDVVRGAVQGSWLLPGSCKISRDFME